MQRILLPLKIELVILPIILIAEVLLYSLSQSQVNIRSIDEAIVIGAALSLSSSAFVLQVFGNHTLQLSWAQVDRSLVITPFVCN